MNQTTGSTDVTSVLTKLLPVRVAAVAAASVAVAVAVVAASAVVVAVAVAASAAVVTVREAATVVAASAVVVASTATLPVVTTTTVVSAAVSAAVARGSGAVVSLHPDLLIVTQVGTNTNDSLQTVRAPAVTSLTRLFTSCLPSLATNRLQRCMQIAISI